MDTALARIQPAHVLAMRDGAQVQILPSIKPLTVLKGRVLQTGLGLMSRPHPQRHMLLWNVPIEEHATEPRDSVLALTDSQALLASVINAQMTVRDMGCA